MLRCHILAFVVVAVGCGRDPGDSRITGADNQIAADRLPVIQVSAEDRAGHQQMLATYAELAKNAAEQNRYYGDGAAKLYRSIEASGRLTSSPIKRMQFDVQLGMLELKLGNEREAIRRLESGYQQAGELLAAGKITESTYDGVVFRTGLAYLRLGETQNCCLRHNPDSCLLPIRGGGIHTAEEGSREAIRYFSILLDGCDEPSKLYYETVWLLNIAYMTLDEYPDAVPKRYRISPAAFPQDRPFPRFRNIATQLGIDNFTMSGGAIAEDFDADGLIDLMVGSWDLREPLKFYKNFGRNRFVDHTDEAGLAGIPGGLNMLQADYNNDGHPDVLVLRGAWSFEQGRHPNSLLRNNGDGTFTDVTLQAGLADSNYPTQTAAWGDYDLDGDLDLYVGNEPLGGQPSPSQLFRNNADGTFTEVAADAGVENRRFAKAVLWGDVDNDRYPDLFISNLNEENRLYRNQMDGTFVDITEQAGLAGFPHSFPAFFWDVDNDGNLDLFVASYLTATHLLAQKYSGHKVQEALARLYHGDGKGEFRDVAKQWSLDEPTFAMGVNFGDLDNDGYLDFYLGTGDIDFRHLVPNKMYHNRDGRQFEDVSYSGGFSHLQKGHAVVFADFDMDGDPDIFQQMGGAYQGDKYSDAYYENPGFGNHWLAVQVVGRQSNRSAIGVKLTARFREGENDRVVHRHVNSGGSFGANPLRQTIGLGAAQLVDRLEVFWPMTGNTQVFEDIAPNQVIRVTEGRAAYSRQTVP